jgi:hypothetical protein
MIAKVFWTVAIAFLVSASIFGAWLGFSAHPSHSLLMRILEAIFYGVVVVLVVIYAVSCLVAFIESALRGFRRR